MVDVKVKDPAPAVSPVTVTALLLEEPLPELVLTRPICPEGAVLKKNVSEYSDGHDHDLSTWLLLKGTLLIALCLMGQRKMGTMMFYMVSVTSILAFSIAFAVWPLLLAVVSNRNLDNPVQRLWRAIEEGDRRARHLLVQSRSNADTAHVEMPTDAGGAPIDGVDWGDF